MKITQVNNRFFIENENGRLHILNWRSLEWNLKHVFGMKKPMIRKIGDELMFNGSVEVAKVG